MKTGLKILKKSWTGVIITHGDRVAQMENWDTVDKGTEMDRKQDRTWSLNLIYKHQVCRCVADPGPYQKWSESATLVYSPYFRSQNHIPPPPPTLHQKRIFFFLLQYAYVDYQSTDTGFAFTCHPLGTVLRIYESILSKTFQTTSY